MRLLEKCWWFVVIQKMIDYLVHIIVIPMYFENKLIHWYQIYNLSLYANKMIFDENYGKNFQCMLPVLFMNIYHFIIILCNMLHGSFQ